MSKQPTAPTTGATIMTQGEVADFLRVSQRHVVNLTRNGILPAFRLGRRVLFERNKVMKALEDISTKTISEVLN
jgi:excisionase family DNA binding protein